MIPVELGAEVDTYYIAGAQLALFGRYAVNYLVVNRYTGSSGVALVIFKVGLAAAASARSTRSTRPSPARSDSPMEPSIAGRLFASP